MRATIITEKRNLGDELTSVIGRNLHLITSHGSCFGTLYERARATLDYVKPLDVYRPFSPHRKTGN